MDVLDVKTDDEIKSLTLKLNVQSNLLSFPSLRSTPFRYLMGLVLTSD